MSEIESKLVGFRRRVRWLFAWRGLAIGAALGATVSLLMAALDFFKVRYFDWPWLVAPVMAGIVMGATAGFFRRVTTQALADSIDRRARLANRIGTANEDPESFGPEVRGDALEHLQKLKPAAVFPVRLNRWHAGALALWALATSVFLLGNTPILLSEEQKKNQEELRRIGQTVERVAKPLLERPPEKLSPEAKELAKKFDNLSKELKKGRMPKEEAMQKANELAKEAEKMTRENFQDSEQALQKAQDALQKIAEEQAMAESGFKPEDFGKMTSEQLREMSRLSDEERNSKLGKMSKEIAELMKQLEEGKDADGKPLSQAAMDALKSQLDALKMDMKALELSQKVKDFLEKLYSHPKFKEIMEMMKKLNELNQKGQQGQLENPQLSEKELAELKKRLEAMREQLKKELEELADKLKDDKAMEEFLEELKKSLEKCEGG